MDENIPPKDNNKNTELEALLKSYPLPEKHKDKGELALELKKIANSLHEKDAQGNNFNNWEAIRKFVENLKNKYIRDENDENKKWAREYYLLHMVIGSSGVKTAEFDFPGEDSIEKFLRLRELSSRLDD